MDGVRAALAMALALALPACGGDEPLPDARQLLDRSADTMAEVRSLEFDLQVEGQTGALSVRSASGLITADGEASGSVFIEQGSLVEYRVVIADGDYYIRGPTGGFQKVPTFLAEDLYDPSVFLDPDLGLAALLRDVEDPVTVAAEQVEGRDTYKVEGRVATDLLAPLLPLAEGQARVPAELWIAADDPPYLRRLRIEVQVEGEPEPTVLTVTLSDFDVPADVQPPA